MSKQRSLIGLAALIGLVATQACSSDSTSGNESSAGTGGQLSAAGTSSIAGTSASQAGTGSGVSGSTGSAGASGSTAAAGGGSGGASVGGSGGMSGMGGALASGGSGGAAADTFTIYNTAKGNVVATKTNITLYVYQPDTPAAGATPPTSACTGTCLTHWPLYYGNPVTVPAGLTASDFGSFDRGGGVMQSTYHGWPVYMYDDDKKPGDILGDMEKNTQNKVVWYAIKLPFTAPPKP
jgi:predicted lipoprotein with Yx(FWY)xxD motif